MKPEEQPLRGPRLSVKSSFIVFAFLLLGGVIFPYLLTILGLSFKTGVMLTLPVSLAFSLVYSHYFIETKQGFCKRFILFFCCNYGHFRTDVICLVNRRVYLLKKKRGEIC